MISQVHVMQLHVFPPIPPVLRPVRTFPTHEPLSTIECAAPLGQMLVDPRFLVVVVVVSQFPLFVGVVAAGEIVQVSLWRLCVVLGVGWLVR